MSLASARSSDERRRRRPVSDEDEVKQGVRDALAAVEPLVAHSGSAGDLKGMLLALEESEENTLVALARRRLAVAVEESVRSEIQRLSAEESLTAASIKRLAPSILTQVTSSTELRRSVAELKRDLGLAASNVAEGMTMTTRHDQFVDEFELVSSMASARRRDASLFNIGGAHLGQR